VRVVKSTTILLVLVFMFQALPCEGAKKAPTKPSPSLNWFIDLHVFDEGFPMLGLANQEGKCWMTGSGVSIGRFFTPFLAIDLRFHWGIAGLTLDNANHTEGSWCLLSVGAILGYQIGPVFPFVRIGPSFEYADYERYEPADWPDNEWNISGKGAGIAIGFGSDLRLSRKVWVRLFFNFNLPGGRYEGTLVKYDEFGFVTYHDVSSQISFLGALALSLRF